MGMDKLNLHIACLKSLPNNKINLYSSWYFVYSTVQFLHNNDLTLSTHGSYKLIPKTLTCFKTDVMHSLLHAHYADIIIAKFKSMCKKGP